MKKHTSDTPPLSIPTWETLEGWIREEIEVRIQSIAEEEVTQFLGRGWYERKGVVDAAPRFRIQKESRTRAGFRASAGDSGPRGGWIP